MGLGDDLYNSMSGYDLPEPQKGGRYYHLTEGYDIPLSAKELAEQAGGSCQEYGGDVREVDRLRALPYKEFLETDYWRSVRLAMFHRHGRSCGLCGVKKGRVDIHHRTYKHHGEELRNLGDLIILCRTCHESAHSPALCMNCLCPRGKGLVLSVSGKILACPECSEVGVVG